MSGETITILGVGVALAGMILGNFFREVAMQMIEGLRILGGADALTKNANPSPGSVLAELTLAPQEIGVAPALISPPSSCPIQLLERGEGRVGLDAGRVTWDFPCTT